MIRGGPADQLDLPWLSPSFPGLSTSHGSMHTEPLSPRNAELGPLQPSFWLDGPVHVDFNLTNGCNLACAHCHSSSGSKLPGELTLDEVRAVLDALHERGVLSIAFAGGEPFIRRDIVEILAHACAMSGWRVSVITNGLQMQRRGLLDELVARCSGLTVNVSLDGSTPSRFATLRQQPGREGDRASLFARVTEGLRALVASGLRNSVNFTLTKATLPDALPTYRLAVEELGADAMVAIKFFPGGYGRHWLDRLDIPYALWGATFADLTGRKLRGELPRLQISVPAAWEFYLPLIAARIDVEAAEMAWGYRSPLRESRYRTLRGIGDVAGVAELCIGADGVVYPSVLLTGIADMGCGSLREQPLGDIWDRSPRLESLRTLRVEDLSGSCSRCAAGALCGGGSRSRAYSLHGSLRATDSACPLIGGAVEAGAGASAPPSMANDGARQPTVGPVTVVVGSGLGAARVLFRDGACELRSGTHVFHGNADLARLLQLVAAPPDENGLRAFADTLAMAESTVLAHIRRTLLDLAGAGVPLDTWDGGWRARCGLARGHHS